MSQTPDSISFLEQVNGCMVAPILTILVPSVVLKLIIKFVRSEDDKFHNARQGLIEWNGSRQTLESLTTTADTVTKNRLPNYIKLLDKLDIRNHPLVQKCELEGFDRVWTYIGERDARVTVTFSTKQNSKLDIYIETRDKL